MEWNFDFEKFKEDFEKGELQLAFTNYASAKSFAEKIDVRKIHINQCRPDIVLLSTQIAFFRVKTINQDSLRYHYPLKQKSLYEQALDLLGVKVDEEFEFIGNLYKFSSEGILYRKTAKHFWELSNLNLTYLLLLNGKINTPQPKSEAELILDELKVIMDKANDILRREGI